MENKNDFFIETFNIKHENVIYQLNIKINKKNIEFIVNILDSTINYFFMADINSIELIDKLGLNINKFTDLSKILNIFIQLYENNKLCLYQIDKNSINLVIKYQILYEENKYEIKLIKNKMKIEDKLNVLFNQINLLTNRLRIMNKKEEINNKNNNLNININKKEEEFKNIINEKNNTTKEISNKLINQIEEMENKLNINFNRYKKEIINEINIKLNKQNIIIKELMNKYDNNKNNKLLDESIDKNIITREKSKENINYNNKIEIDQSSIIQKKTIINETNETEILKEILKEMTNKNKIIEQNNIINTMINNNNNFKLEKNYLINNNNINYKYNIEENYKNENNDLRENDYIIEDNNDNKEYSTYNDKINYKFKKNPKFLKFKQDITNTNTNWGANDIFEVFLSYKDNKEYIISPNYISNNLEIYSLTQIKLISSLEGHKNRITVVRYFINKKNNFHEYLISADYNKIVIIWDITNNYKIKYKISTQYGTIIYSCLLLFPDNINENYIVTSTNNVSEDPLFSASKVYLFNNGEFLKNIINTNNEKIYYLLSWYNQKNKKYYILQFAYKKILINNLLEDELYSELSDQNEYYHYSGFIYNKNNIDYLCSSSSNGYINIWNLYYKKLSRCINTNSCILFHIIKWNSQYIIVADYNNKSFKLINLYNGQIIKDFNGYHNEAVKCIKKIYHPIYGETLLTSGEDKSIKLWII